MLGALISEYRGRLIGASVVSSLSAVTGIVLLMLVNNEITALQQDTGSDITVKVLTYAIAVLALFFISFFSQFTLTKLSTSLVCRLRGLMLKRVLGTEYATLDKLGGHRILATLTTDVGSISSALAILPVFAFNVTSVVLCCLYLLYLSPPLFAILLTILVSSIFVSKFLTKKGLKHFKSLREREDELHNSFKTLVDGAKELSIDASRKAFFYECQAMPNLESVRDADITAKTYFTLYQNWLSTMLFVALGVLVFAAGAFIAVSMEVLVGFVVVVTYLTGPFAFITTAVQGISRGRVAYAKINKLDLNQLTDYQHQAKPPEALCEQWQRINIKQLHFQYRNSEDFDFSVGPVDLQINRGELLFICGGNGSGKSTFAKVLVGLYEPDEGSIELGNTQITAQNLEWYKRHFCTVFSDFYLFDHILDRHGNPVTDDSLKYHLEKLQLDKVVNIKEGRFSTTRLSQGQRKRLALLQAYVLDAPIYVFDEWAADQDPHFRKYFYTELLPQLKSRGKTVIVISHDDGYFNIADRIYKFDNGKAMLLQSLPEAVSA